MNKLRALFLLIFLFSIGGAIAQESGSLRELHQLLAKNLKYPTEMRQADIEGPVVISIKIDPVGNMTGEYEYLSGNPGFQEEIDRVVEKVKQNWKASYLKDKTNDLEYLMSFEFKLSKAGSFPPNPFLTSQKPNAISPLEKVNAALQENPYFPNFYTNRAEILKKEGKEVLAEMDLNQANFLKEKMLAEIVIVGYLPSGPKSL